MSTTQNPATDVLQNDATTPHAVEQIKNIRNTQPGKEDTVGKETVGQGLPTVQSVKNEESLPATAVPVERNFSSSGEFYNPLTDERAAAEKDASNRGAQKTDL